MVIDCFPFFNELDLLEIRLHETESVVDRWVITEADLTFSGRPKPYYFHRNRDRFKRFLDRITYITVCAESLPEELSVGEGQERPHKPTWGAESFQRNRLADGVPINLGSDDIVCISDCDEIPAASAFRRFDPFSGAVALKMDFRRLYLNWVNYKPNIKGCLIRGDLFRNRIPGGWRGMTATNQLPILEDSGWHLAWMGSSEELIYKMESFSHWHEVKVNPHGVYRQLRNGSDKNCIRVKGTNANAESINRLPRYVLDHWEYYRQKGWVHDC